MEVKELIRVLLDNGYTEVGLYDKNVAKTFISFSDITGKYIQVWCETGENELIFQFGYDKTTGCKASILCNGTQTDTALYEHAYYELCVKYVKGEVGLDYFIECYGR